MPHQPSRKYCKLNSGLFSRKSLCLCKNNQYTAIMESREKVMGGFQLEFVSACHGPVINLSVLIDGKFILKKSFTRFSSL